MARISSSRPSPLSADTTQSGRPARAGSATSQAAGKSALLATRRAAPGCPSCARSSSRHGSERSRSRRTRSADSVCWRVRSIPARSIASSVSCTPAVSTSSTGQPSKAVRAVTRSRVVPGVGSTICALVAGQSVEQPALPHVWPAGDHDPPARREPHPDTPAPDELVEVLDRHVSRTTDLVDQPSQFLFECSLSLLEQDLGGAQGGRPARVRAAPRP